MKLTPFNFPDLRPPAPALALTLALAQALALPPCQTHASNAGETISTPGSLWQQSYTPPRNMVADRKATQIGDILTITVSENTQITASQQSQSSRSNSLNDEIARFLYSTAASKRLTSNGEMPALSWQGSSERAGGGEVSNRQNLNSKAAVMVSDILPNGNLVIEGVRELRFSEEKTYVYIRGVVRADDVRADNTVLSSNIAHAKVEFINEGSLTDSQRRGWLTRFWDAVTPF